MSKQELQGELDQPRIRARRGARNDSKVFVVDDTADRVGWGKLCSVKSVKEFCTELETPAVVGAKSCSLEDRHIKVVDSVRAQPRIDARLVAEGKIRRRRKARGIEPSRRIDVVRIAEP